MKKKLKQCVPSVNVPVKCDREGPMVFGRHCVKSIPTKKTKKKKGAATVNSESIKITIANTTLCCNRETNKGKLTM